MLFAARFASPLDLLVSRSEAASSHLPEAILGFAASAIWGGIALVALIVFRRPIAAFLSTVGGRLSKLSIAGIELELASAPRADLPEDAKSFGGMDPQSLASDSTSQVLVAALNGPALPDSYAVIDLGTGRSWLSSRLFIFAIMLQKVRGVRCFAFVDRSGRVPNEYLGAVSTEDIRGAIALRYPWLERIFAKAYKDRLWPSNFLRPAMATARTLQQYFAADVVQEYVALLKKDRDWEAKPVNPNGPTSETMDENFLDQVWKDGPWVNVGKSEEYGCWIDRDLFYQEFKEVLHTDQIQLGIRSEEKMRELINSRVPFVALVRSSGQFVSLIDRSKALDSVSGSQSEAA